MLYLYLSTAIANIITVSSFINIILYQNNLTAMTISLIYLIRRFARIILEIPFGIIGDRFGIKVVLILSQIFKIIGIFLVINLSETSHIFIKYAYGIFAGLTRASGNDRSGVYIYRRLESNKKVEFFRRYSSIYWFIVNIISSLSTLFLSFVLVTQNGLNKTGFFHATLITSLVAISLLIIAPNDLPRNKKKSFKKNMNSAINMLQNHLIVRNVILLSFLSGVLYSIFSIGQLMILQEKLGQRFAIVFASIQFIALPLGALFSSTNDKEYSISTRRIMIMFAMILAIAGLIDIKMLIVAMIVYAFFYMKTRLIIEKRIEALCKNDARSTISSVSLLLMTIIDVTIFYIATICSKYSTYRFGFSIMMCAIVFSLTLFYRIFNVRAQDM